MSGFGAGLRRLWVGNQGMALAEAQQLAKLKPALQYPPTYQRTDVAPEFCGAGGASTIASTAATTPLSSTASAGTIDVQTTYTPPPPPAGSQSRSDSHRQSNEGRQQQQYDWPETRGRSNGRSGNGSLVASIFTGATLFLSYSCYRRLTELEASTSAEVEILKQYDPHRAELLASLLSDRPAALEISILEEFQRRATGNASTAAPAADNFALVFAAAIGNTRHPLHKLAQDVDLVRQNWRAYWGHVNALFAARIVSPADVVAIVGPKYLAQYAVYLLPLEQATQQLVLRAGRWDDIKSSNWTAELARRATETLTPTELARLRRWAEEIDAEATKPVRSSWWR